MKPDPATMSFEEKFNEMSSLGFFRALYGRRMDQRSLRLLKERLAQLFESMTPHDRVKTMSMAPQGRSTP